MRYLLIFIMVMICSAAWGDRFDGTSFVPIDGSSAISASVTLNHNQAIHNETFEDDASWTPTAATVENETALVRHYLTAKESVKMTCSASGTPWITKTMTAVDLRGSEIEFSMYVDADNKALITTTMIQLSNAAHKRLNMEIQWANVPLQDTQTGWYTFRLNPYLATNADSVAARAEVLDDVTLIRIFQYRSASSTPWVVFDRLGFVPIPRAKAQLLLSFDDGLTTDFAMANYLTSRGLRATFFVCGNIIDTASCLTKAQLTQLQNNGHLIANHNWNHEYFTTANLTPDAAIDTVVHNAYWLRSNGFLRGANILGVPGGTGQITGWANDVSLLSPYVDFMRFTGSYSVPQGYTLQRSPELFYGYAGPFDVPANCEQYVSADSLLGKVVLNFGFHTNSAAVMVDGQPTAAFVHLIDLLVSKIQSGDLECRTYDELVYSNGTRRFLSSR